VITEERVAAVYGQKVCVLDHPVLARGPGGRWHGTFDVPDD